MTPFEDELRKALARREPSADFVSRVLAQTDPVPPQRHPWFAGWFRFAVVAAMFVLVLSGGLGYRHHLERVRGEAAKQQLLTALHIAGTELREAQMRVQSIEKQQAVMQ
jgi:hypothetical protein